MQATITYLLTEQAQRAQMAATGQPVARKQSITEEIPSYLINSPLARIADDGTVSFDLTLTVSINKQGEISHTSIWASVYPGFDTAPSSGLAAVQTRLAEINAKCAEVKAKSDAEMASEAERNRQADAKREAKRAAIQPLIDAFLADPIARAVAIDSGYPYWVRLAGPDGNVVVVERDLFGDDVISRLAKEAKRRDDADEAAKEQAKQDFIASWVEANGDDLTKAQFAEGLLSRKLVLAQIADAAFAAAGVPQAAPGTVCEDRNCPCGSESRATIPPEAYALWIGLRKGLPEGTKVEFAQVRNCLRDSDGEWPGMEDGEDSAGLPYIVADIKMPHGPFVFERRVEL